jgi:hypothetical protein
VAKVKAAAEPPAQRRLPPEDARRIAREAEARSGLADR